MRYKRVSFNPTAVEAPKRRARRRQWRLPWAHKWVKGISVVWLLVGLVALTLAGAEQLGQAWVESVFGGNHRFVPLIIFLGVLHVVVPVGLLSGHRYAWMGGVLLSFLTLVLFPIGTIAGFITIKALFDCRDAFGLR